MSARVSRTAAALVLAPWLICASTMPPEHLHEADEHHSHAVTHRHFEAHDHEGAEIDHDEGRIVWLDDGAAVVPAQHQPPIQDVVDPARFETIPDLNGWIVERILDDSPPHGPPRRSTSLRAPPSLSS